MDDYGQSYDSPVLVHLDERMGEPVPGRDVACTTCPVSLWYWRGNNELVCFCSALHQEMQGYVRVSAPGSNVTFNLLELAREAEARGLPQLKGRTDNEVLA